MTFEYILHGTNVHFFNRTVFGSNTWFWDFGDGATSTLREPLHTYPGAGTYPVTLTAVCGSKESSITKNVIIVLPISPLLAYYNYSPVPSGSTINLGEREQSAPFSITIPVTLDGAVGNTVTAVTVSNPASIDMVEILDLAYVPTSLPYVVQDFADMNLVVWPNVSTPGAMSSDLIIQNAKETYVISILWTTGLTPGGSIEWSQIPFSNNGALISTTPALSLNNFTIEMWAKVLSSPTPQSSSRLVDSGYTAGLCINYTPGGYIEFISTDTTGAMRSDAGAFPLDTWTHIAFVRSGSTGYFYKNGILTKTFSVLTYPIAQSAYPFLVAGGLAESAAGRASEVRLWNVARSGTEIAEWYQQRMQPSSPNLVLCYRLNESNNLFSDQTGAYPTATLPQPTNTYSSDSPPCFPPAKLWSLSSDYGLVLDGSLVTEWSSIGDDRVFIQGTTIAQPTYDTTDSLNGKYPVRFANKYMYSSTSTNQRYPISNAARTLSALVRCTNAGPTGGDASYNYLMGYGGNVNTTQPFAIGVRAGGNARWWGYGISASAITSSDGQVHLITLWYDGTTLKLYRDGTLISSGARAHTTLNTSFHIGTWSSITAERVADASIWEVSMWSTALTDSEMTAYKASINAKYGLAL